jgi:cell wall-associated NlpC family hydrolase
MASARGLVARVSTAVLATCALLAPSTAVYAAPSATEVQAQIDAAWEKLEPLIEQYNGVHSQLKNTQAKAAELQGKIAPLQLQVELALDRVSDIAVRIYKGGTTSAINAILTSGSPTTLADQLSMLNQLARADSAEVRDVIKVRDQYSSDKAALDTVLKQLAAQDADLAAKKADVEKQIAGLQKLRQQAYGSTGAAVAASGALKPTACPVEAGPGGAGVAATTACNQIGKPYSYGSEGPSSFDCSGLTMYSWRAGGRSLPHNAKAQYQSIKHIGKAELRTGDLVFFYGDIHHVGIYVGGGYMVHAPTTGDRVRMASIDRPGVPTYYGRVA